MIRVRAESLCVLCLCVTIICLAVNSPLYSQLATKPEKADFRSRPLYQSLRQTLDNLAKAELARQEASIFGEQNQQTVALRESCRVVIVELRQLETQFTTMLQANYRIRPSQRDNSGWTVQQLESLIRNLKVQLARGYRNQALCYDEGSLDRINSLNLALDQLAEIVTLPLNDQSVWRARLEQAACLRLLSKPQAANEVIKRAQRNRPPPRIASRLDGEMIRLALAADDVDAAWAIVGKIQKSSVADGSIAPETDDAVFATILAAYRLALPERANELTNQAKEQLRYIAARHGRYWQRRAEFQLGLAIAERTNLDDTDLLAYAAASLYASGKTKQAVAKYDRLAQLQAAQGHADYQFEALQTAAAIVAKSGNLQAAITRYRELALQNPQHAKAASMHMVAIGMAAEASRKASSNARGREFEHYLELLEEHLSRWPNQSSARRVRQWLDRARQPAIERQRVETLASSGNRQQALQLLRSLQKQNPNNAEQAEEFAKLLAAGDDIFELREALQAWAAIEKRSKPGGPRWWRGRRARLVLLKQLGEGEQAKKLQQLTDILYPAKE